MEEKFNNFCFFDIIGVLSGGIYNYLPAQSIWRLVHLRNLGLLDIFWDFRNIFQLYLACISCVVKSWNPKNPAFIPENLWPSPLFGSSFPACAHVAHRAWKTRKRLPLVHCSKHRQSISGTTSEIPGCQKHTTHKEKRSKTISLASEMLIILFYILFCL